MPTTPGLQDSDFGASLRQPAKLSPDDFGGSIRQYSKPVAPPQRAANPTASTDPTDPAGVQSFVTQAMPHAQRVAQRLSVSVDAVLGQWGLETGWGKSVIPGTNNFGNIKSLDGTGVAATDNATGSRDKYQQFADPGQFADRFASLLQSPRYKGALSADPQTYFQGLKDGGYAQDRNYVKSGLAATKMVTAARTRMASDDGEDTPAAPAAAPPPSAAAGQPPLWQDLIANPAYATMSAADKTRARDDYFTRYIEPVAGDQAAAYRARFNTSADLWAKRVNPSLMDRAGELLGDARHAIREFAGTLPEQVALDKSKEKNGLGVMEYMPSNTTPGREIPVTPEYRRSVTANWNSATPEVRAQMATAAGPRGYIARTLNAQHAAAPASAGDPLGINGPDTMTAAANAAYSTPTLDAIDPRWEARARQLVRNGTNGADADAIARADAARDTPLEPGSKAEASSFDFAARKKFNEDPFFSHPLVRGAVKGYEGYKQGLLGVNQFAAEMVGADASGQAQMGRESRGTTDAMGEPTDYTQRMFEGTISSIAQQIPALVGGAATGSEGLVLGSMFAQSFGQEYSEGRSKGQSKTDATTRAGLYGAFEVIGEKFGLGDTLKGLRGAVSGMATKDVATTLSKALLKEIPGEELTTLGEFLTDKLPGGVGLNTQAGMADYLQQAGDTLVQTMMQGGVMGAGGTALAHGMNKMDTPARQIAREINQNADSMQPAGADKAARAALDPNRNAVDPRDTTRTAADVGPNNPAPGVTPQVLAAVPVATPETTAPTVQPAPPSAAAPVTPAANTASAGFTETPDGFTAQIQGDDGQMHTLDSSTGINERAPDKAAVDEAAHVAATSPHNDRPQPTDAQKEAGNYVKGHISMHGLDISIENPQGSTRSGTSPDGKEWSNELAHHYGFIRKTTGADNEQIDTFIGPNPQSTKIFVVDQIDPATGKPDEHKVMIGFDSQQQADDAYHANYEKGWTGRGAITETSMDQFKGWLKDGKTKEPFAPQHAAEQEALQAKSAPPENAPTPDTIGVKPETEALIKRAMKEKELRPGGTRAENFRQGIIDATEGKEPQRASNSYIEGHGWTLKQLGATPVAPPKTEKEAKARRTALTEEAKNVPKATETVAPEEKRTEAAAEVTPKPKNEREAKEQRAAKAAPEQRRQQAMVDLADKPAKELRLIATGHARAYMRDAAAGILEDRAAETSAKRSAAMKQRMKRDKRIDTERDTMAQAIAKMGGINRDSAAGRMRLTPEELGIKANVGNLARHVFVKNGGMTMDQAGAAMAEHGYVESDEHGKHDQHDWEDKLAQAANGEDVHTAEGMVARAEHQRALEMEELQAKSELEFHQIENMADDLEQWAIDHEINLPEDKTLYHDEHDQPLITEDEIHAHFVESETQAAGRPDQDNSEGQARASAQTGADAPGFLESQTSESLKAKDARANDGALADKELADSQRDAFSLSAPPGSVTGEAKAMSNSRQESMFGAEPAQLASKPRTEKQAKAERAAHDAAGNVEPPNHGPVYTEFRHDAPGAIAKLTKERDGEALAVLTHPAVGDIDLVWGKEGTSSSDGFGLAKIVKYHPEVLADLQGIIDAMTVTSRGKNRIVLESADHKSAISLNWFGREKTWLLTTYEKAGKERSGSDTTIDTAKITAGDDTARPSTAPDNSLAQAKLGGDSGTTTDIAGITGRDDTARPTVAALSVTKQTKEVQSATPIEDFGSKLEGARKDVWSSYADKMTEAGAENVAEVPLSKSWPEPEYQKLLNAGADPWVVSFIHAARDEIPTKPSSSWRLKSWAGKVETLRSFAGQLLNGEITRERLTGELMKADYQGLRNELSGRVELYEAVGHEKSLKGVRLTVGEYGIHNGVEQNPPKTVWTVEKAAKATSFSNWPRELASGATRAAAIADFKAKIGAIDVNPTAAKTVAFDLYSKRGVPGKVFIGKKIGKSYVDLKTFDSVKEAREYKATNQVELERMLAAQKEIPSERNEFNAPRVGRDHRHGADVTPEQFAEQFSFRGVQFGNYVEGSRRQTDLNQAYDALMDMAGVLGIPARALSLNGELGLSFGARGKGGKNAPMAHYERGQVVINLTKGSGAGSLGHEWFHALDNYFSRARSKKNDMATEASDVALASRGSNYQLNPGMRREMVDAFGAALAAIHKTGMKERARVLDSRRSKEYWGTVPEMAARSFESYLIHKLHDQGASNDYLSNIVSEHDFKLEGGYPYPTAAEIPAIRAGFDHLFATMETRQSGENIELHDIPTNDASTNIMQAGPIARLDEPKRVATLAKLKSLQNRRVAGKLTAAEFQLGVAELVNQLQDRNDSKTPAPRERGEAWVRERLMRAKRLGELDGYTVDFALWALDKNPALAADLAISLRATSARGTAGSYQSAGRLMTLIKDAANSGTAVHEILHHSERMMPPAVQKGIAREWAKAYAKAWEAADPKARAALEDLLKGSAGSNTAFSRAIKAFQDGTLKYDQHYQLSNASEFWAVNATDIMAKRYAAAGSWVAQAKQWLSEMIEHVKGMLGLRSDAAVLKGLRAVLNGDGARLSSKMLTELGVVNDIPAGAIPLDPTRESEDPGTGLTPPEQGLGRRLQAQLQDNLNRVKQVQERIAEVSGSPVSERADAYAAEMVRPGRIAARLEDARDKLTGPLMERIAKAGKTPEQVSQLLHAMHAKERNAAVAEINPKFDPASTEYGGIQGSGMNDADARVILQQNKSDAALHALAEQARDISKETLELKLAYGLITAEDHERLVKSYGNYVPLKGDGEFGPKVKRAMGHEAREEHVLENIARDYDQAVTVGEKNLARQSLLQMVLQHPDDELWTARVPPKGRYVAGKVFNIVHNGQTVGSFTAQSQVSAFLEAKGAQAVNYEVLSSNGERVAEFTKQLQDNEIMVYVKGSPVRIQIFDEKLAAQLRPLNQNQMGPIIDFLRTTNRWLSMVYTGYNPAFILRNMTRDAITGTVNMLGNEGAATTAKAWAGYPAAFAVMGKWAATKQIPTGKMGAYLREYRSHGGKVGASWLSDLEQQGKTLARMYDDAHGARGYLADGKAGKAAWIASRKIVGGMAHVVEVANQAAENAMRLSLYATLRDAGATTQRAAQAAKSVTVDFDRKGASTGALGALYLFFNPAVQGTANAIKTLAKGAHKEQAWAALGGLAMLGFYAAAAGLDDDKDRWLGEQWDTRTKNLIIGAGDHHFQFPMSQEFAPAYALGVALAEASRGESKMKTAGRLVTSFIDAYFPLHIAKADSKDPGKDALMGMVPTIGLPAVQIILNRNTFGNPLMPESEQTKDRPDNLKMFRGTKNTVYDSAAQGIADVGMWAGLAGKYENDLTKVSPETLKMLWRTYTGGLGTFVTDSIGLAAMGSKDASQIESSDVPIVKDFYRKNTAHPIEGRFHDLADEAKGAIAEFASAKKMRDGAAVGDIVADNDKFRAIATAGMVTKINKAQGDMKDQAVTINADPAMSGPAKREALKKLEAEQEALYRRGIEAFK